MSNKKHIVDAKGDRDGDIVAVKFAGNSSYTDLETAINMAKKDQVEGVHVSKTGQGREYLRTNPDGTTCNNLDTMVGDT